MLTKKIGLCIVEYIFAYDVESKRMVGDFCFENYIKYSLSFEACVPFTDMVWLQSQYGYVTMYIMKRGMKLLIQSQTSTVAPLKFGDG